MAQTKKKFRVESVSADSVTLKSAENDVTIKQTVTEEERYNGFLDNFKILDTVLVILKDSDKEDAYRLVSAEVNKFSIVDFNFEEIEKVEGKKPNIVSSIHFAMSKDTDFAAFCNTYHKIDVELKVNPTEQDCTSDGASGLLGALAGALGGNMSNLPPEMADKLGGAMKTVQQTEENASKE